MLERMCSAMNWMTSSGSIQFQLLLLLAQDGDARFDVGRFELGDQAPLEAGDQALLQAWYLAGRPVAGHDDLLVAVEEGVEGVEELLLHALLAAEEMNVVDQQQVDVAVLLAELHERTSSAGRRCTRW